MYTQKRKGEKLTKSTAGRFLNTARADLDARLHECFLSDSWPATEAIAILHEFKYEINTRGHTLQLKLGELRGATPILMQAASTNQNHPSKNSLHYISFIKNVAHPQS